MEEVTEMWTKTHKYTASTHTVEDMKKTTAEFNKLLTFF